MAGSSVSDFPHRGGAAGGDIIDLDHYMTGPVFQYDAEEPTEEKCVIDAGSFENRISTEHQGPPSDYKDAYSRGPGSVNLSPPSDFKDAYCRKPENGNFRTHSDYKDAYHRNPENGNFRTHSDYKDAYSRVAESGNYRSSPVSTKRSPPMRDARARPTSDYVGRRRDRERASDGSESSGTFRDSRDHRKQYSVDSGVSDGAQCSHPRRSGFHSNVDFYERRRRRDFERSSHKLRNRNTYQDVSQERSQSSILKTLREQQEKLDRLAALCEEALQPKRPESSSSDLSSSLATREELPPTKKHGLQDKMKKLDGKLNETRTYKIIMRKLDELNEHFARKQPAAAAAGAARSSSGDTKSSAVSVSDKGVCTSVTKKSKTASARSEARRRPRGPAASTSSTDAAPASRRATSGEAAAGPPDGADARRLRQIYAAFASVSPNRSRIGDYDANMFGMKDYNLNDPISFYNRAKHLSRGKSPSPPQKPPEINLCSICRGYWSRLHWRGLDFCKQVLCCGDGVSVASGLIKKE